MQSITTKALILIGCLLIAPATWAWGEGKYCYPFSDNDCKKGDLIMIGGIKVLEYCDFGKNVVTINSRDGFDYIACYYIGEKRKNRKK